MMQRRTVPVGWLLVGGCCLLLLFPAALVAQDSAEDSRFYRALLDGDNETVQQFIDAGVDVNRSLPDLSGHAEHWKPPLMVATSGGVETMRLLLGAGADINQMSSMHDIRHTPLHAAISLGLDLEIARFLIEQGADLELGSEVGTPLAVAAVNQSVEHMVVLIEAGADLHVRDAQQNTILLLFIDGVTLSPQAVEFARTLIERGVDPNEGNSSNERPLTAAARNGDAPMVELLVRFGAEIDATDKIGRTALHWAAEKGRLETVRMLVEAGAGLEIVDRFRRTPLATARSFRGLPAQMEELVQFLSDAVAGQ